jgi:hypothetical protein
MSIDPSREPGWLDPLCRVALQYRTGNESVHALFERAAPNLDDPRFLELVPRTLRREPDLVMGWQQYSGDKRGTPSPYLDGLEVGFFENADGSATRRDVRRFDSAIDACAAFIWREAAWVLERREAT